MCLSFMFRYTGTPTVLIHATKTEYQQLLLQDQKKRFPQYRCEKLLCGRFILVGPGPEVA